MVKIQFDHFLKNDVIEIKKYCLFGVTRRVRVIIVDLKEKKASDYFDIAEMYFYGRRGVSVDKCKSRENYQNAYNSAVSELIDKLENYEAKYIIGICAERLLLSNVKFFDYLKAAADGDLTTLKWVFTPDQNTEYAEVISSDKATITVLSNENTRQSVVRISVGKRTGGILARASVAFRTEAYMFFKSDYRDYATWWNEENNFSKTVTTAKEKYYFVAYCAPLSYGLGASPEMYFPDSYIPTSAYTLTTKVTVKKLNDKCYEITDSDLSTYKELVLTYTCGKQVFTYTTKIVPR